VTYFPHKTLVYSAASRALPYDKSNTVHIVLINYILHQVAHAPFTKQRVSIIVDAHLLAEIDKLTDNRSAAFEEAPCVCGAQKIEEQLRQFYQNRSQADIQEEEEGAVCSRANGRNFGGRRSLTQ